MERNCIQFQKGYGLAQFVDEYAAKEQCMWTLFRWRWPDGFVFSKCLLTDLLSSR